MNLIVTLLESVLVSMLFYQPKDMLMEFDRASVPEVVYDDKPQFIKLYYKAWEIAFDHIKSMPGLPVERHMDEGFSNDRVWIWDTCFMAHYCKYAPDTFPGIESLDNFYYPLHDGVETSCLIQHPDNPPLFAWVEYEYYKFTGDLSRIRRNLVEKQFLQKHYQFIEDLKIGQRCEGAYQLSSLQKHEAGYFWSGISSGMDNTPRGNDMYCNIYWLDILAQQALSAYYINKLAEVISEKSIQEEYQKYYQEKADLLNRYYYDEQDGSYYDIYAVNNATCNVLTPASFWPLLAGAASEQQAKSQVDTLLDNDLLGGDMPIPTVARNSKFFCADGRYWRGGVWMPASYMVLKAIEKYHYTDLAASLAEATLEHICYVYHRYLPQTIWEAYSPTQNKPAAAKLENTVCRPDFCGWSALGPISMLIENIIGISEVDAKTATVTYHHRKIGRHGIRDLKFGDICCDIIADNESVNVTTNKKLTLVVGGASVECLPGKTQHVFSRLHEPIVT